jgi:hypothetical protein
MGFHEQGWEMDNTPDLGKHAGDDNQITSSCDLSFPSG